MAGHLSVPLGLNAFLWTIECAGRDRNTRRRWWPVGEPTRSWAAAG